MNIDAIFFDLGMVLVTFDWNIAIARFIKRNGGDTESIKQFLAHPKHELFERNEISEQAFFEFGRDLLHWRGSQDEFRAIWSEIFQTQTEAVDLARQLARDYPLYIISNTNPWHAAYVESQYEWLKLFRKRFYSCDLGVRKPGPRIYQIALSEAQVQPERALFIDDRLDNLEGAKQVGMQILHAPTTQELEEKLKQFFSEKIKP